MMKNKENELKLYLSKLPLKQRLAMCGIKLEELTEEEKSRLLANCVIFSEQQLKDIYYIGDTVLNELKKDGMFPRPFMVKGQKKYYSARDVLVFQENFHVFQNKNFDRKGEENLKSILNNLKS